VRKVLAWVTCQAGPIAGHVNPLSYDAAGKAGRTSGAIGTDATAVQGLERGAERSVSSRGPSGDGNTRPWRRNACSSDATAIYHASCNASTSLSGHLFCSVLVFLPKMI